VIKQQSATGIVRARDSPSSLFSRDPLKRKVLLRPCRFSGKKDFVMPPRQKLYSSARHSAKIYRQSGQKKPRTSPRTSSRLFNEQAGMNITGYINGLRVALAHQLLKSSRLDIERIAERHRLRLIPAAATRLAALLRLAAHYAARLLRPSRLPDLATLFRWPDHLGRHLARESLLKLARIRQRANHSELWHGCGSLLMSCRCDSGRMAAPLACPTI